MLMLSLGRPKALSALRQSPLLAQQHRNEVSAYLVTKPALLLLRRSFQMSSPAAACFESPLDSASMVSA